MSLATEKRRGQNFVWSAIHLARVLLAASQEWEEIDIKAWRVYKRQTDNTYNVTVTSAVER